MSGINSINGNNALAQDPEGMDDDFSAQADQLSDSEGSTSDSPNLSHQGASTFKNQKVNELAKPLLGIDLSSYNTDPEKKKEIQAIIDETLGYLKAADDFESQNKTTQALTLEKDAGQKIEEIQKDLGQLEPLSTDPNSPAPLSKQERKDTAGKLEQAASKIGYVHYDIKKEQNQMATAAANFFGVIMEIVDIKVKAKYDKPYTVGHFNIDQYEQAMNTESNGTMAGDTTNTNGGDHSHTKGDEIDQRQFKRLEAQQKQEADTAVGLVKSMADAMKETNPDKQKKLWKDAVTTLDGLNTGVLGKTDAGVFNATQLAFNAIAGELGKDNFAKALQTQAIPKEFAGKFSQILDSKPKGVKDEFDANGKKKENEYFRGGSDWTQNGSFISDNSGSNSIDGDSSPVKTTSEEPPVDSKPDPNKDGNPPKPDEKK